MKDGVSFMKKTLLLFCTIAVLTSCTSAKVDVRGKGVVLRDNTVVHYLEAGQGPASSTGSAVLPPSGVTI